MKVLSLFDGVSCGRLALERAGVYVDTYYASEVDKFALQITQNNYPDNVQLGDVTQWHGWDIPWHEIDLVIGGSPCQGFSFAGKQLAFDDPRSKLFFDFVDILNHVRNQNPDVKFMLENVRMKKEFLDVITGQLGVEPVVINSALVSAQNRVRYYWCNWYVGQPDDLGINLVDVLEEGVVDRDKSYCIDANYHKGGNPEQYFNKSRRQLVFRDKSQTILSTTYKENAKSMVKRNKFGLLVGVPDSVVVRDKSKTVRGGGRGSYDRHEWDSISNCHYRKLTVTECERLQTMPDGWTAGVSNTQRYKVIGNAWTVDVIAHIFRGMD